MLKTVFLYYYTALFIAIIAIVVFLVFYIKFNIQEHYKLKTDYPNEPWKWDPDWLKGVLKYTDLKKLFYLPIPMLFAPTIYFTIPDLIKDFNRGEDFAGIAVFMIAVLYIFIYSVIFYSILSFKRWLKYGNTYLYLDNNPLWLGENSQVTLQISENLIHKIDHLTITLRCSKKVENSMNTMWETQFNISINHQMKQDCMIPISFSIPNDLPETIAKMKSVAIRWPLIVENKDIFPKYHADFIIPVFEKKEITQE